MAAMKITLLAVATISAVLLGTASAATYGVGEPGGSWTLNTDYSNWVSNKKFHPGDEIIFKYSPAAHDVVEVSKAGYDSCSTASAINTFKSGNDVVPLNATGIRYFICGITGHCSPTAAASMKVVIDVVPSSSSPSSPMPAAGPDASNPPPPSSTASSVGATAGFGLVVLLVASLMV
ncbi:mavicyanin-like [Triticum dicoccoides]|uniref:mavicyanin-like n=1 Tax=Triticum dicoccoides TaxID=85692 RepID=UPI00188FFC34|nr:mavicyanin-like [Triticum dicoccoides]